MPASAVAEPQHFLDQQTRWRAIEIAFWIATPFFVLFQLPAAREPDRHHRAVRAVARPDPRLPASCRSATRPSSVRLLHRRSDRQVGVGRAAERLLIAALAAGLLGYVTSFIIARFRHLALIMITLGLGLLLAEAANSASWLTGGADGLQGVRMWKPRPVRVRSLRSRRLRLFARRPVPDVPGGAAADQLAVRSGAARNPRECHPHACGSGRRAHAYSQSVHHRRGHGRHCRRAAGADHRDGLASIR